MKRWVLALVAALMAQLLGALPVQSIEATVLQPRQPEFTSMANPVPAMPVLEKAESRAGQETARPTAKTVRPLCALHVLLPVCDANGRVMAGRTYRHCYYQVFHAEAAAG